LDIQRYLKVVMLIDALFEHQLHKRRHGYAGYFQCDFFLFQHGGIIFDGLYPNCQSRPAEVRRTA
jgi:hypothetical protein